MGCTSISEMPYKNNVNNYKNNNSNSNLNNLNKNISSISNNNLKIHLKKNKKRNSNNNFNKNKKRNLNNNLNNVRSVYILQRIFDIIPKNKHFGIIRYNKKLQKRLDLSINDYKECSELFTSIEIEIKTANNIYDSFINILELYKDYYHIYFDDNKKEIKRCYLTEEDKVNKIKIKIDYQVKSFKKLFYECYCIESIYFKKFYRNNITDMSDIFYGCSSLKELNLSNFNTNNVTDMSWMFSHCSSLTSLNLSSFYTNKVNNIWNMFFGINKDCNLICDDKKILDKFRNKD